MAILCPGYGWVPRGIETVVSELSRRLCRNWQIDIFTLGSACATQNPLLIHVPGISRTSPWAHLYASIGHRLQNVVKLRSAFDFEALTFSTGALPFLLNRPYTVIMNCAGPFGGYACMLKRRKDGTPFVHSAQGQSTGWLELMHADQHPDYYFALTKPSLDWISRERPDLPVAMIPNGVDVNHYRPGIKPVPLDLPRPVFLFVGAMTTMKRPDLAIEAVALLDQGSLLMIGDGEGCEQYVQLGLARLGAGRFLHIPYISQQELPAYYNACDVFTLPSPSEPFGIVFLEAMACNRPVVAHAGQAQTWILGDAGLTCNCEDVREYAAALQHAASMTWHNTPQTRSSCFTWDAVADLYQQYLDTVTRH
jgi:glycosyltransferase involved in cell wall biosynthesis